MAILNLIANTTIHLNTFEGRTAAYLCIGISSIVVLLVGNSLVIAAVFTQRALKNPSYYILTSLAFTDIITGAIAIPLDIYRRTVTNDITCSGKWDIYLSSVVYMTGCDSMLHMVMITVDRYLAVMKPLRYHSLVTPRRIMFMVILSWTFSALFVTWEIIIANSLLTIPSAYCTLVRASPTPITVIANDIFIFLLINSSNLAVVIFNVRILRVAVKQARSVAAVQTATAGSAITPEGQDAAMRRIRASRVIVCVVVAFVACHTSVGMWHLSVVVSKNVRFNSIISHVAFFLFALSSMVNPIIYGLMDRVFRQSVVRMLRSVWRSRETGVEDNTITSVTDRSRTYAA